MAAVGAYIFSVAATALLCGMITSLLQNCSVQKIAKFICGMILLTVVLRPVSSLGSLNKLEIPIPSFPEGQDLITSSVNGSQKAITEIIKQNTQAYIVDKAAELGLEIRAEVVLSNDALALPVAVTLYGNASPYLKLSLQEIIQEELNIAKENQVWTG